MGGGERYLGSFVVVVRGLDCETCWLFGLLFDDSLVHFCRCPLPGHQLISGSHYTQEVRVTYKVPPY